MKTTISKSWRTKRGRSLFNQKANERIWRSKRRKSKKVDWFEIRCLRNKSFNQIDGKRILRNNGHNQNSANVTLKEGRRKEGSSFSEN